MKDDWIVIDLEGDGLDRLLNKQVFPEGNHFDAETVPWCCTVCRYGQTITLVCKLPETTRTLPGYYVDYGIRSNKTKAYHCKDSSVPKILNGHKILEFTDRKEFLEFINKMIKRAKWVLFKGYGDYEYDKDLLQVNFNKYGITNYDLTNMKSIEAPTFNSHEQITTGGYKPNQEYLIDGIKHNIDDALSLYKYIKEKIK